MRKISNWLYKISSGWLLIISLVVFLLFMVLVLPAQSQQAAAQTGSSESVDTSLIYSPADLYAMAQAYGPQGRQAYIQARIRFDIIWPIVYTLFLATGISWALQRVLPQENSLRLVNLLPLVAILLDYLENLTASIVMARYPQPSPFSVTLAPIFTFLKWLAVGGSFILLLVVFAVLLVKTIQKRR